MKEDAVMGTKLKCVFEKRDSNGETAAASHSAAVTSSAPSSHDDKSKRIGDSVSIDLLD